jgi:Protein of unknown function (DUF1569)
VNPIELPKSFRRKRSHSIGYLKMDYLKLLYRELDNVLADLPESEAPASAEKWNPAQILEHLFLTYRNTNKGIARCLEAGAPQATRSTLKQRLGTLLVVELGYFPKGRKAPERTVPRGLPANEVRSSILAELQKMESSLAGAEHKFGASTKIMDHPVLGPFTVVQWRKFHWVHGCHHCRQIRERARS